jgi:phospholipid/cholesterol/gamma-HCH transport system ATP-binding protein
MVTQVQNLPETNPPAASGIPVVQVHGLYKAFGNNRVLNGFDLSVRPGENVVVLGKSGSGKSVLIKCISGLLRPDAGSIRVLGQDITQLNHDELDEVRAKIGFLFQSGALYDSMTVRENLEFPLHRHGLRISRAEMDARVLEALENVGLRHTVDLLPSELSGGMRKRIGIARTLIMRPELILYDEPTAGLDPITAREISQLIVSVQRLYGASAIIITHDLACARTVADRIVVLLDGVCAAEGSFRELQHSPDAQIRSFFD